MSKITGDQARRMWTDLRRAEGTVMRLERELQALHAGVDVEARKAGRRYDRSWAMARANALAIELAAAYAKRNRLEAAFR